MESFAVLPQRESVSFDLGVAKLPILLHMRRRLR
jgi:hypothetical protein